MTSLALKLRKESLQGELENCNKNFEEVDRKYRREPNPEVKNSLKDQKDELLEKIEQIEKELLDLKSSSDRELLARLRPYFDREKDKIQNAYKLALPERLIDNELPQSLEGLMSGLQLPQPNEDYSCLEKFVGHCLLDQNLNYELKQELKEWAEENIQNSQQLLDDLSQERRRREQQAQQCEPGLLVAISEREKDYCVEAWLIKNINRYQQNSSSDCERLKIDGKESVNKTLSEVPNLIQNLIYQSLGKCDRDLKQVHLFVPHKLMNSPFDCWKNCQDEEYEDDYSSTIGEDYEVLLRCSERLRGKSPHIFKWRDKGYKFKSELRQAAVNIFILIDSRNPKILFRKLKDDRAIAVKITTVFQNKEPGILLFKAATPIALWIRQQIPNTDNRSALDNIIGSCCLQELPDRVKSNRLDALACEPPESHVGRHLCLLWDDPDLLPPEQLLTDDNL